jgi:hypothetical protein
MGLQKLRRMVRRPQFGAGAVALLATERQLDLAVANQTIGHLRQVGAAHGVGSVNAAMAGEAGVGAVQLGAPVARLGKVLAAIDGLGDYYKSARFPSCQRFSWLKCASRVVGGGGIETFW